MVLAELVRLSHSILRPLAADRIVQARVAERIEGTVFQGSHSAAPSSLTCKMSTFLKCVACSRIGQNSRPVCNMTIALEPISTWAQASGSLQCCECRKREC